MKKFLAASLVSLTILAAGAALAQQDPYGSPYASPAASAAPAAPAGGDANSGQQANDTPPAPGCTKSRCFQPSCYKTSTDGYYWSCPDPTQQGQQQQQLQQQQDLYQQQMQQQAQPR